MSRNRPPRRRPPGCSRARGPGSAGGSAPETGTGPGRGSHGLPAFASFGRSSPAVLLAHRARAAAAMRPGAALRPAGTATGASVSRVRCPLSRLRPLSDGAPPSAAGICAPSSRSPACWSRPHAHEDSSRSVDRRHAAAGPFARWLRVKTSSKIRSTPRGHSEACRR